MERCAWGIGHSSKETVFIPAAPLSSEASYRLSSRCCERALCTAGALLLAMGVVLTSVLTLSMWNPPPCSKCQKDMHEFSAWPPPAALWMMMMMIHHQIIRSSGSPNPWRPWSRCLVRLVERFQLDHEQLPPLMAAVLRQLQKARVEMEPTRGTCMIRQRLTVLSPNPQTNSEVSTKP